MRAVSLATLWPDDAGLKCMQIIRLREFHGERETRPSHPVPNLIAQTWDGGIANANRGLRDGPPDHLQLDLRHLLWQLQNPSTEFLGVGKVCVNVAGPGDVKVIAMTDPSAPLVSQTHQLRWKEYLL
jgi:hypothetical protein